jgi:hypothetical protein
MNASQAPAIAESPLLTLLAESALAVEQLAANERHRPSGDTQSSRDALLAIELRLKLEEQVLLPRFRELDLPALDTVEKQIDLSRELLAEAKQGEMPLQSKRLLWAAIERMGTLHFETVAQLTLLAEDDRRFNANEAWREAEDYRARWRAEIADSGDIEDEALSGHCFSSRSCISSACSSSSARIASSIRFVVGSLSPIKPIIWR